MASASKIARIERLVWILIYGGLLCLVLGIAVREATDRAPVLMVLGGVVAAIGVVLIFVRARMREDA